MTLLFIRNMITNYILIIIVIGQERTIDTRRLESEAKAFAKRVKALAIVRNKESINNHYFKRYLTEKFLQVCYTISGRLLSSGVSHPGL